MLCSRRYVLTPFDAVLTPFDALLLALCARTVWCCGCCCSTCAAHFVTATIFNIADAAEQLRKLETSLNKIGLGTLAQKFCDEKLDFETLLAASDKELTRLKIL